MRSIIACSILLFVSGCSPDSAASGDQARFDGRTAPPDTLALLVDIPSTRPDGSINFGFAFDAAYLRDGSIAVADYALGSLLFFDSSGRFVRSIGTEGSGPGEFTSINWIESCGDTIVTMDYGSAMVIAADGTIVSEFEPPLHRLEVVCSSQMDFAGLDTPDTRLRPLMDPSERLTSRAWIADQRMEIVEGLGSVPFGENRLLGKRTRIAIDTSRIYLGVPDSSAIEVYDFSGARVGTLQLYEPLLPATAEHYEAAIDEQIAYGTDAAMADDFRRQLRSIPLPLTLPPYSGIFVERDGVVWAVLTSPGGGETRLRSVDLDGKILADAVIPADLRVFDVGPEFVIGRIDDPVSGVQRIAAYRKDAL